ncbi:MAG: hypothetical protein QSU88_07290, partial [Candidatus Methanoperedens sp.]|nr:hypothetical protein [Candidatus Methanoperedens sp.]
IYDNIQNIIDNTTAAPVNPQAVQTSVNPSQTKLNNAPVKTPQSPPRRLFTGTLFKNELPNYGQGTLKIINGLNYDAVVILVRTDDPKNPVLKVYIEANDEYEIDKIPNNRFFVYYMTGTDWDRNTEEFTVVYSKSRFVDYLSYVNSGDGYEITLNPVKGGNAETEQVIDNFPK